MGTLTQSCFVYCCCLMNVELSSICHDQLLFVGASYSTAVILISQFYLHWSKLGQAEKIKRDFSQEKKKRLVLTCHFTRFFDVWFVNNPWYAVSFTKFYFYDFSTLYVLFFLVELRKFTISDFPMQTHMGVHIDNFIYFLHPLIDPHFTKTFLCWLH